MHVQKQERKYRTFSLADKVTREGRRVKAFTPIALCTNMLCATGEGVKAKKENRLTRARGLALDARVPAAQSRKKKNKSSAEGRHPQHFAIDVARCVSNQMHKGELS